MILGDKGQITGNAIELQALPRLPLALSCPLSVFWTYMLGTESAILLQRG